MTTNDYEHADSRGLLLVLLHLAGVFMEAQNSLEVSKTIP